MNAPMTFNQFLRHWRRYVDREIRARVTLPGSQHFSLDEMEAELLAELKEDPMAKGFSLTALVKRIVESTDRVRRPKAADAKQQEDMFRFEHKWIPVGKRKRVRYCDATSLDLNEWLRVVNDQFARQSEAYTAMVAQIQRDLSALLRSESTTIGDLWRSQYGWEPTEPDDGDDEGDDDEGDDE